MRLPSPEASQLQLLQSSTHPNSFTKRIAAIVAAFLATAAIVGPVRKRAGCTATSYDEIAGTKSCSATAIHGPSTVPAEKKVDLTGLKTGTTITISANGGINKPKFIRLSKMSGSTTGLTTIGSPIHTFSINNCKGLTLTGGGTNYDLCHNTDSFDIARGSSDISITGAKVYNNDDCLPLIAPPTSPSPITCGQVSRSFSYKSLITQLNYKGLYPRLVMVSLSPVAPSPTPTMLFALWPTTTPRAAKSTISPTQTSRYPAFKNTASSSSRTTPTKVPPASQAVLLQSHESEQRPTSNVHGSMTKEKKRLHSLRQLQQIQLSKYCHHWCIGS
ncbi:hypothetical protein BC936DRAFT_150128 [Jimgerdemannia flammicorona]|uniref:Pectin lyase fold/virulence factor n=1 Tax=Jimgerdemannia flammicorona TaxID=994334 RepID=A0A433CZF5_9FUNG|nr:hypothetical protein BC936DRAFT_150128 [Jimgerdemannia flammicorona]